VARYTARYEGNGLDTIRLAATRVRFAQTIAPDTPVPRLLQGLIRSFVQREAASAVRRLLDNVRREVEAV
jgi:hypothetical protein